MSSPKPTTKSKALYARAAAFVALATLAAIWSVYQVDLLPPRLTPRSLDMGTASTSIVVDTPTPALIDQIQDTYAFGALTDRALLLGSVMADGPIRAAIAREAGIPVSRLHVEAPRTTTQPRVAVERGKERRTGDILKSNDQYRLAIEVNPTVPVIDVYAQAPTAARAEALADAAFVASRAYASRLENAENTPPIARLDVKQLGRARGAVINDGVQWQIAGVIFGLTLALLVAGTIVVSRIRRGWRLAVLAEPSTEP